LHWATTNINNYVSVPLSSIITCLSLYLPVPLQNVLRACLKKGQS
jgi:hypothetical protein